jgi:iodotyrosine deiodinase
MTKAIFDPLDFSEKSPEKMIEISNSFYADLRSRRSVRDFSDRPVPDDVIRNALLAAGTAPSGANMQPWHFVVIIDQETKKKIRQAAEKEEKAFYHSRATADWLEALRPLGTDANKSFLETAPCLIAIFLKKYIIDANSNRRKTYYPTESVGIATGILITALHLSGLATLTHTPSPMGFLNPICKRPVQEKPFLILVTGYPAKDVKVPQIRKKSLDEIATFI